MSTNKPSLDSISPNSPAAERLAEKYGVSGYEERRRLRADVRAAKERSEAFPDNEDFRDDVVMAEYRLALFEREHDNAGAFKFNRFGREMKGFFEGEDGAPPEMRLAEDGRVGLSPRLSERQVVVVNMGELDRFNKEGGHRGGNDALASTAHAIESAVVSHLKTGGESGGSYKIFRFTGNEFMVILDGVNESRAAALAREIASLRPTTEGVTEGAPLSAQSFVMAEAAEIMNALPPENRPSDVDDANREIVSVIRQLGEYRLDVEKFAVRASRVRAKLQEGDRAASEAFFNNYMAKTFTGTGLDRLEDFEELLAQGDATWNATVERLSLDSARRRLELEHRFEDERDDIIKKRTSVRERLGRNDAEERLQAEGTKIAEIPAETAGQRVVRELMEKIDAAGLEGKKEQAARLAWMIEDARHDRGTGLLDRGSYYDSVEAATADGRESSVVFVDMAFLKYFDQKGGRAVGDDAVKLSASLLERAIAEAGLQGEAYRYGGDEFTVRLDGGDAEMRKFTDAVLRLRDEAGAIPARPGSSPEYVPTRLAFNFGGCDRELLDDVYADLCEAGHYADLEEGSVEDLNARAELMTVIAEKSVEGEKARDRFRILIRELRSPEYAANPIQHARVESLMLFSNKAVFAEIGGDEAVRRLAEGDLEGEALDEAVAAEVNRLAEKDRLAKESRRDLVDHFVDLHVQIKHLSDRLAEAERETETKSHVIADLRARLEKVNAERRAVLGIRGDLAAE